MQHAKRLMNESEWDVIYILTTHALKESLKFTKQVVFITVDNKKHIEELEMQKYEFPDFSVIDSEGYKKVASYNDFIFYEKIIQ